MSYSTLPDAENTCISTLMRQGVARKEMTVLSSMSIFATRLSKIRNAVTSIALICIFLEPNILGPLRKKKGDSTDKDEKAKEVEKKTPKVKAWSKGKPDTDQSKNKKVSKGDSFLEMKSILDEVKKNFLGEIRSLLEEMKMYKRSLYNSEQQHCGHFRPTPCEAAEYHHPCQQRRKTCLSLS